MDFIAYVARAEYTWVYFLFVFLWLPRVSGVYFSYYRCVVGGVYFYIAGADLDCVPAERRVVLSSVEPVKAGEHRAAQPREASG